MITPHPSTPLTPFLTAARAQNGSNIPRMLFTTVLPLHYLKGKAYVKQAHNNKVIRLYRNNAIV